MTDDDELERRLRAWGHEPVDGIDPVVADRVESQLRASAAEHGRRRPPVLRPALVLGAVVLVVLTAVLVVRSVRDQPVDVLVIQEGAGAVVVLPGGDRVDAVPGTEVPDGSRVEVAPGGFLVVDDVVLPAGSEALVVDGIIEVLDATPIEVPPTPPPAPTVTPESRPSPTTTPRPTSTPAPDPTPTVSDATEPTPEARPTPTASVEPDRSPEPTTGPTTGPTEGPRPSATPETRPTPTVTTRPMVTLERTNLGPRRALLTWRVDGSDRPAGYEVRIRRGDTISTAARLRDPDASELMVERPRRSRVFYRVLALDAEGEVIARSNEVRVTAGDRD